MALTSRREEYKKEKKTKEKGTILVTSPPLKDASVVFNNHGSGHLPRPSENRELDAVDDIKGHLG